MELVSHTKVVNELRQSYNLDEKCSALIFDSQSGELFAWHGDITSLEAVSTSAVLYNCWGSQADTAQQHDEELQVAIVANEQNTNCLIQIRPSKESKLSSREAYTLAIVAPDYVQIGALKRLCQQIARQLQPILYQSSVSRKK